MPLKRLEIAKEVEREHRQLNKQMHELKSILFKEIGDENFSEWRLHFLWKLRDFKNALLKHFDLEEEGGFMAEVLKAAPQESKKVDALKVEHESMIASIDVVLKGLKNLSVVDKERMKHIRNDLNHLIFQLESHEKKENRLMQRAYYREFGYPS